MQRKNIIIMETTFKDYPIYKKRDGQGFKEIGSIYSISFEDAKKRLYTYIVFFIWLGWWNIYDIEQTFEN